MKKSTFIIFFLISMIIILLINSVIILKFSPSKEKGMETNLKDILTKERIESGFSIANVISNAVLEPLLNGDEAPIMDIVVNTVKNSDGLIDYIIVIDDNGIVFGDSKQPMNVLKPFNDPSINLLKSENRQVQDKEKDYYDLGLAIKTGDKKRGEIHLGLKKVTFEEKTEKSSGSSIIIVGITFILGIVLSLIFSLIISSKLSAGKDFVNLRSSKIDELRKQEEELQKSLASKNNEIKSKEQKISELEKKIKETGSKYDEVDRIIRESEQEIEEKKKQVEFYENKISELVEKQKSLKEQIDKVKESESINVEAEKLKNQISNLKIQLQQIINDIEVKRNEEKNLLERINQLKTQASAISQNEAIGGAIGPELEKKKKEEFEITQRIVAKRKEEIAISQRLELKRKKELELTGRLEMLEKKLKEMGNG